MTGSRRLPSKARRMNPELHIPCTNQDRKPNKNRVVRAAVSVTVVENDLTQSSDFYPWKKGGIRHEIDASLALPFKVQGRAAVLMVYAA